MILMPLGKKFLDHIQFSLMACLRSLQGPQCRGRCALGIRCLARYNGARRAEVVRLRKWRYFASSRDFAIVRVTTLQRDGDIHSAANPSNCVRLDGPIDNPPQMPGVAQAPQWSGALNRGCYFGFLRHKQLVFFSCARL